MPPACRHCTWFDPFPDGVYDELAGVCRFGPPSAVVPGFPTVKGDDWCQHFIRHPKCLPVGQAVIEGIIEHEYHIRREVLVRRVDEPDMESEAYQLWLSAQMEVLESVTLQIEELRKKNDGEPVH